MKISTKLTNYLKNLTGIRVSPNSDIHQGVQARTGLPASRRVTLGLLTSFGRRQSSKILAPALALALAIAVLGISLFSQTAYAASYINVSSGSGGTISFDSIKPSSAGVSASASDTLTITTNCSAGYSVYVSGQDGGDTNLTNTNSSVTANNTISASSTAVGSTATTLNSNTWGITGDSASASANKYVGLPAYANSTDAALITVSSANTSGNNTNTIYYGVKVDTALTPGTYAGDVLYTVLMNNACLEYTLKFDANGATTSDLSDQTISFGQAVDLSEYSTTDKISKTGYHLSGWKIKDGDGTLLPTNNNTSLDDGELSELTLIAQWEANTYTITYNANAPTGTTVTGKTENQTKQAYGSTTTLQVNGFTIDGYEFKGWAYSPSATEKNFDESQANVSVSALAENNASGSVVNTNGGTITLYAVWGQGYDGDMQSFACGSLASGATAHLRDTRDNQIYTVYRIPTDQTYAGSTTIANIAGYCIMTKDLNLGAVAFDSSASSKMETANSPMTLSPDDSNFTTPTGSGESITVPTDSATVSSPSSWSNANSYSNKQYKANGTGDYAGRGYYTWGAAMVSCPKGWRLPTADEYSNSTSWEGQTAGLAAIVKGSDATGSIANIKASPYSFVLGGAYYYGLINAATNGIYWSSTQASSPNAYTLFVNSADGIQLASSYKMGGNSVRCIQDPYYANEDCSDTIHVTTTKACKMKDNAIYLIGNNGDTITWNDAYTDSTGVNMHNATLKENLCPGGYFAPSITELDELVKAYGGYARSNTRSGYHLNGNSLYVEMLGGTDVYGSGTGFSSSTERSSTTAYYFGIANHQSWTNASNNKTDTSLLLCRRV